MFNKKALTLFTVFMFFFSIVISPQLSHTSSFNEINISVDDNEMVESTANIPGHHMDSMVSPFNIPSHH